MKLLSHIRLLATSWTAAYQAPPSMGFSRQQYWSGVPLPSLKHYVKHAYIHHIMVGAIIIPILELRKQSVREIK